ncbi:hypothetical protein [Limosilactobacillus reuteri]|uniref:Uncharacterized protein n=1 Tax=Limosilactobacillus reuteri TaxID=1598 RepID=A0ABD6Y6Z0_LIMRT|nr:hypothetical protein [Limosilactobacillus reuteri]PWT37475.1 hypothetical protein DKZ35_05060 [Limosilactobacillus reuteri]
MVKRIEAEYQHGGAVYYFKTDDRSVTILDENNNEIGTLEQLAFNGKTITGGDIKDITHTGLYKVKGVSGLPGNVPANQECMLAVQSIGAGLRLYRLIAPNGVIVENTVSGNTQSGWGSGGVGLRNTISSINNALGSVHDLKTQNKNLTAAINEVLSKIDDNQSNNNERLKALENKNFDSRYLLNTGGNMMGNIAMRNGNAYQLDNNKNQPTNFAYMDGSNTTHIGDGSYTLQLHGSGDLKYNGAKVFTTSNIGSGSGLDSDKLDGIDSMGFIQTQKDNPKQSDFSINEHSIRLHLPKEDNNNIYWQQSIIQWRDSNNQVVSDIESNGIGDIVIRPGGQLNKRAPFRVSNNNFMEYFGNRVNFVGTKSMDVRWQTEDQSSHDGGLGFFIPDWNKNELAFGNWNTHEVIMEFAVHDGEAIKIAHSPYIGDHNRRLFLQDEQPGGDVPYGSLWVGF